MGSVNIWWIIADRHKLNVDRYERVTNDIDRFRGQELRFDLWSWFICDCETDLGLLVTPTPAALRWRWLKSVRTNQLIDITWPKFFFPIHRIGRKIGRNARKNKHLGILNFRWLTERNICTRNEDIRRGYRQSCPEVQHNDWDKYIQRDLCRIL